MQLTVPRESFLRQLGLAASIIPERSPNPACLNVLLSAELGGPVCLASHGRSCSLRIPLAGLEGQRLSGRMVLPPDPILAAMRDMSADDEVTFTQSKDDPQVDLRGKRAHFKFESLPPAGAEIPVASLLGPDEPRLVFQAAALSRALLVAESGIASGADTRYALQAVRVEGHADRAYCIGTDGCRMVVQKLAAMDHGNHAGGESRHDLIGGRHARLLAGLLAKAEGDVALHFGRTTLRASLPSGAAFECPLVEGRHPNWRITLAKIPDAPAALTVPVAALLQFLRRVSVAAVKDREYAVDLRLSKHELHGLASAPVAGSASVRLEVQYDGPDVATRLNYRLLADALPLLPEGASLDLFVADGDSPIIVKCEEHEFLAIVMPLAKSAT